MTDRTADPLPRENLLKLNNNTPMQFMKEYLVYDSDVNSLIRFLGPFIMPNWNGVEDNEFDYVIQNSWTTLYQIANEVYNDPLLQWVIASRNHLDLPDVQLYKGKRLKIPNRDWVESYLLPQGRLLRGSS